MTIKQKAANFFANRFINPLLAPICWGRVIPEGYEQWKHVSFSWSQFGEDLVIRSVLQRLGRWDQPMTYVDVGSYHPIQYSNTLLLHARGWNGINIDPNPATIQLFRAHRPNDLNLLCGISSEEGKAFYQQSVRGEISATGSLIDITTSQPPHADDCVTEVPVRRLDEILSSYDWQSKQWGLLNVDTEGTELQVLQSNCWSKYRPLVISVEENFPAQSRLDPFLAEKNYKLVSEYCLTKIFVDLSPKN